MLLKGRSEGENQIISVDLILLCFKNSGPLPFDNASRVLLIVLKCINCTGEANMFLEFIWIVFQWFPIFPFPTQKNVEIIIAIFFLPRTDGHVVDIFLPNEFWFLNDATSSVSHVN